MATVPRVIVFDVNETLSDMAPIAARFVDVGAPSPMAKLWFASVLRDGFALTAAGSSEPFARVADGALRVVLGPVELDRSIDEAVDHVMSGFMSLAVHPDVVEGVDALRDADIRLVTLSNGSAQVAERLLVAAGIRDRFERLLSVEDAGAWKPARASYDYAARICGVDHAEMMLVAVHPWDIDGASRAGMQTAWINRDSQPYPAYCTKPDHELGSLPELATRLDVARS
ncbi:MAG: haloacid dehalogenase type II [Acidimicrobiales bacterium]